MNKNVEILERKVIHAGKVFIREGEDNARAYIIQAGSVRGFIMQGEERIEVTEHGPGDMIGEVGLVLDDPAQISYEAIVDTTVITVTRQDFEKKLARLDKSVKTILDYMTQKLQAQDRSSVLKAAKNHEIDDKAFALMRTFTMGLPQEKKFEYETAILPHINALVKVIKDLKTRDRHARQAAALQGKIEEITQEGK